MQPSIKAVDLQDPPLMEIQDADVRNVSVDKARQAFLRVKQPVLVEDGGLYIHALKGFPGAYTKYVMETIGPQGLLKLMEDQPDRSCTFRSCLVYIDHHTFEQPLVFESTTNHGSLALQLGTSDTTCSIPFHPLFKLFIPTASGFDRPLSQFTPEEWNEYRRVRAPDSPMAMFSTWWFDTHFLSE